MAIVELILAAAMARAVATPPPARPHVDVQVVVEPAVRLSPADVDAIARTVRAIWRPAIDVALEPSMCAPRTTADLVLPHPQTCLPQAPPGAVTVVVTNRVRRLNGSALGWTEFVDGTPQPVLTVSMTEVVALMNDSRWHGRVVASMAGIVRTQFVRRAVALAVAHEMGHYLLQSTTHTARGLMQAAFAADDVMDAGSPASRLSGDEIGQIQQLRAPLSARRDDDDRLAREFHE